jgi:hypothetical protein
VIALTGTSEACESCDPARKWTSFGLCGQDEMVQRLVVAGQTPGALRVMARDSGDVVS